MKACLLGCIVLEKEGYFCCSGNLLVFNSPCEEQLCDCRLCERKTKYVPIYLMQNLILIKFVFDFGCKLKDNRFQILKFKGYGFELSYRVFSFSDAFEYDFVSFVFRNFNENRM